MKKLEEILQNHNGGYDNLTDYISSPEFMEESKQLIFIEDESLSGVDFHNNNGHVYTVLGQKGNNAILEQQGFSHHPYVVTYGLDTNSGDWASGSYFSKLEDAKEFFKQKFA